MAHNLDPDSDGRGVLQFKTGLMSVIKVYFKLELFTGEWRAILVMFQLFNKCGAYFGCSKNLQKGMEPQ
ncbi:hypothetical protein CsatA_025124 [Cannabis sativa]